MSEGYIRLHRKFIKWEWYTDINTCHLFQHCILKANYVDRNWRGIDVKRGSFVTSREKLSNETGLSHQQVRTALKKLILTNELTKSATSKNTILTVVNYDKYQFINQEDNQQITNNSTNEQPTSNQQVTTTNKEKNKKNVKNVLNTYSDMICNYTSNELLQKALHSFIEMRMTTKGFTARALELALGKLDSIAINDDAKIEVVNQSVMNTWKSFFPLKIEKEEEKPF